MAIKSGLPVSPRKNVWLNGQTKNGEGSFLFVDAQTGSPTLDSTDRVFYVDSNDKPTFWDGTQNIDLSGGGGGSGGTQTLNDAYDDGATITVDNGAVTLAGSGTATAVLNLTADGATSVPVILIANSGSGNDITGTSSTWSVSKAGAAVFTQIDLADNEVIQLGTGDDATIAWNGTLLNIAGATDFDDAVTMQSTLTVAGSAGSDSFTLTAGDAVLSDGSLSITDADNAETVTVINNTATTIGAAASAGVIQIESTSLTTGAAVNVQLTEGTLNGGFYYSAWDATGGSRVFSVGENGATTVAGAAGSNVLTVTAGDVVLSDGSLTITDADNANTVAVTNNTLTSGTLIAVTSTSLTTGIGLSLTFDGMTSGSALYIESSAAGMAGEYIRCYDGAADDFVVGANGAVTIAGSAQGTDALTLTAGDILLTSGHLDMTDGNFTIAEGKISATSTSDEAVGTFVGNASAVSQSVVSITQDHTTGAAACLTLDQDDVSEEFVDFVATDSSGNAVDTTNTTPAAIAGSVIVAANGTKYRLPLYAAAGWS